MKTILNKSLVSYYMKIYITRKIQTKAIKYLKDSEFIISVYKEDKSIPGNVLMKYVKNIDAFIPLLYVPMKIGILANALPIF